MTDIAEQWREAAKRDDVLDLMVPSDVRMLVGEIDRSRRKLAESEANELRALRSLERALQR